MKKTTTLLSLLLIALMSFSAHAELWLIGEISTKGWDPSQGDQFTAVDANNYTLDVEVKAAGKKYYSLTTKLGANSNDWSSIQSSRFGGSNLEVVLDTETELQAGSGDGCFTNFTQAGTYTITFNTSTKKIKVSLKEVVPPTYFSGTIFISKESVGNIWAWDSKGNYFTTWPGQAINTLETATINEIEYYKIAYNHTEATAPGLIFNNEGAQTPDITPEDGMLYTYTGGTSFTVQDPDTIFPAAPDTVNVYVLGEVNGNAWGAATGVKMTAAEFNKKYTAEVTTAGENEGYSYFSFTTALAEADTLWNDIAANRFGAVSEGDFWVTDSILGKEISLTKEGYQAFKIPAGKWQLALDYETMKLVITGEATPVQPDTVNVYVLGEVNGNAWGAATGVKMTAAEFNKKYTAEVTTTGDNEGYSYFGFSTALAEADTLWNDIAANRFGAVSEGDFWVTDSILGKEISLTKEGYQAFKIPAGKWQLALDYETMKLVITGEATPVQPDTVNVYILGEVNGNAWGAATGVKMTATEFNKKYTAVVTTELEENYFEFTTKLAEADSLWNDIAANRFGAKDSEGAYWIENYPDTIALAAGGPSFRLPKGEWTLNLDYETMKLVITGEATPVQPDTVNVYVLGEVNGNAWGAATGVKMTATEFNKKYTAEVTTAGENEGFSYFSFSTALAEADTLWNDIAANRFGAVSEGDFWVTDSILGKEISLTKEGYQAFKIPAGKWQLALDYETMKLVITGEATPVQPDTVNVYVLGEVNGNAWGAATGVKMTATEFNKKYTAVVTTELEENYFEFTTKLAEADSLWNDIAANRFGAKDSEGAYWIENYPDTIALAAGGPSFRLPKGEWTLNLDYETMTLVVNGEATDEPVNVYVLGELNGNTWAANKGVPMKTSDNKIFTAVVTTTSDTSACYFSFTTKLAEADSLWNDIAPFRFGAELEGEGDYWITEEMLGETLTLGPNGSDRAYRVEVGSYELTLNLETRTLVVTIPTELPGDVNGDGIIDVGDLNELINLMLNAQFNANADINNDQKIDIADLNAFINLMMGVK